MSFLKLMSITFIASVMGVASAFAGYNGPTDHSFRPWSKYSAGMIPVFKCSLSTQYGRDYYMSTQGDCEASGNPRGTPIRNHGHMGYVYAGPGAGLYEIVRCNNGREHISTINGCPSWGGYWVEGPQGYANY